MSHTRMTTLPFLLLALSPFVMFDSDYSVILCLLCKSKSLWNIFMILGRKSRTGPDEVSRTRMTTLAFLLLELSPFVMSDSDYPLISCPLCKSKTLWIIFMILGRKSRTGPDENDNSGFLTLGVISLCLKHISRLLCNWNTLQNILMVLGRTVE